MVDTDLVNSFKFCTYTSTRGHPYKLILPTFKTDTYKYFFTCRLITIWNNLRPDFTSIKAYKQFLTLDNLKQYLKLQDSDFSQGLSPLLISFLFFLSFLSYFRFFSFVFFGAILVLFLPVASVARALPMVLFYCLILHMLVCLK